MSESYSSANLSIITGGINTMPVSPDPMIEIDPLEINIEFWSIISWRSSI
jgi:hypothetical protein